MTIELSNEDAEKYKLFCLHYPKVSVLLENKVFEVKGGSVMIQFDKDGTLRNIVKNEILYNYSRKT